MPYISVHVDFEEVYQELRDREKQQLVDWLKEDGYLTKRDTEYEKPISVMQELFEDDLTKIRRAYFMQELFEDDLTKIRRAYLTISAEDAELINQIAKRY